VAIYIRDAKYSRYARIGGNKQNIAEVVLTKESRDVSNSRDHNISTGLKKRQRQLSVGNSKINSNRTSWTTPSAGKQATAAVASQSQEIKNN
jgi:hypothetical protein